MLTEILLNDNDTYSTF